MRCDECGLVADAKAIEWFAVRLDLPDDARELAAMGCTVVLACRDKGRGEAAAAVINETTQGAVISRLVVRGIERA